MSKKNRLITFDLEHLGLFTIGLIMHDLGNIEGDELNPLWERLSAEVVRRGGAQWDAYIDDVSMNGLAYMSELMDTWITEDNEMLANMNGETR